MKVENQQGLLMDWKWRKRRVKDDSAVFSLPTQLPSQPLIAIIGNLSSILLNPVTFAEVEPIQIESISKLE